MRYLIKFSKEGYIKYISHLDMIRLFKRAFKKADIKLQYSQGFNPHPKMTFAQPLSLGYTSLGELLEIETKIDYEPLKLKENLQSVMPEGIIILECDILSDDNKGVAGRITEAKYIIQIDGMIDVDESQIESFLKQEEIITLKKQKKKKALKEVNIKPMIREIKAVKENDKIIMTTTMDCGSSSNLNPELILQGLANFLNMEIPSENVEIQRDFLK